MMTGSTVTAAGSRAGGVASERGSAQLAMVGSQVLGEVLEMEVAMNSSSARVGDQLRSFTRLRLLSGSALAIASG